jgi:hypothetical protein
MSDTTHRGGPELPSIKALADQAATAIAAQREEILSAFVAKYGFEPDEAVQVISHSASGVRWHIMRRMDSLSETIANRARPRGVFATEGQIALARKQHQREGHIEIDDLTVISTSGDENGFYILGWLWVPEPEAEEA